MARNIPAAAEAPGATALGAIVDRGGTSRLALLLGRFRRLGGLVRAEPHTHWWREAVERMRQRDDLGVYHEAYLVPRSGMESIYMDTPAVGMLAFGDSAAADGPLTTAVGRLLTEPSE